MFFQVVDILETITFAISWVLVAMNKSMDAFGAIIIAFVEEAGGVALKYIIIVYWPLALNWRIIFINRQLLFLNTSIT